MRNSAVQKELFATVFHTLWIFLLRRSFKMSGKTEPFLRRGLDPIWTVLTSASENDFRFRHVVTWCEPRVSWEQMKAASMTSASCGRS